MFTKSIWNQFADTYEYPVMKGDTEADVAIIGAGVTGISTAYLLAQRGYKVVVLESLKVGGGTSSHSTGNLYSTIDKNLGHLKEKYDTNAIRQVVSSRAAALDLMEKWIRVNNIDCDFKRQAWYLYSTTEDMDDQIREEFEAAKDAGVEVKWAEPSELPYQVKKAIRVSGQAQLNPMRYVQGLANIAAKGSCRIFEDTRVTEVDEEDELVRLHTTRGTVTARFAVHATHIPKGIMPVQLSLDMYREYGIAYEIGDKKFPSGIFWGYHYNEQKYSTRLYEREGRRFLMIIGEPHRVGQADSNKECIRKLEAFAHEHFGLTDPAFRWGGQNYKPVDLLPYIGPKSSGSRVHIATGFSTDGLVYGTLAAMIITDAIDGKENPWKDLYEAHRFRPVKGAKEFVKNMGNTAKQYLRNLPGMTDEADFSDIRPGQGVIVEKNGHKIGAYRTEQGELQLVSAVCTHMKCIVNWNNAEKTWDCPCHATRFRTDGTVLEGPAFDPLERIRRDEKS